MPHKKLIFVNRFFHPDISATAQLLTDLTTSLAASYEVTVVTSRALYNDPQAGLERHDEHQGVEILRLNTTRKGRAKLWGRTLDYLSFHLQVFAFLVRHVRRGDLVVLKTDPPLLSLVNTAVVRIRGGRVINWLQDLFPEIAIELGALPRTRLISAPLIGWRNRTLKAAAVNVVISFRMQEFLTGQGVTNTRVIPNWADGELITPLSHAENALRAEWNPEQCFLVGYSGNFGRAHSFNELIEAMTLLQSCEEIRFVLIGEGAGLNGLLEAVERKRLQRVRFYPYQPYDNLKQSLGAVDLHIVTLKEGIEGLVFPSKFYGALAAGRPVAFVGEPGSEIAKLIHREQIGFAITPGDGAGLAEQIRCLLKDKPRQDLYRHNARSLFEREFTREHGLRRWAEVLAEAGKGRFGMTGWDIKVAPKRS